MAFSARISQIWQHADGLSNVLLPLAWIFRIVTWLRRCYFRTVRPKRSPSSAPVVVVGNITVGGSGKTPFVMWLLEFLRREGFHPGIVSRGYGGQSKNYPCSVDASSDVGIVGDEPLMIAAACDCPVVVDPDRPRAVSELLRKFECDVVISDDGLQHYAMARDVEIIVVNGRQGFGNGRLLPAGPLREGLWRLGSTPWIVANGEHPSAKFCFRTSVRWAVKAVDVKRRWAVDEWRGTVHAVAGIGDPQQFFQLLRDHGLNVIEHPFPDHYHFTANDIQFDDQLPIFVTQKDWIKIRLFATPVCWYVPLEVQVDEAFIAEFRKILPGLRKRLVGERIL